MYPTFHTRGTAPMRLLLLLLASVPACLSSPLVVWRWAAQSGAFQDGGRQGHQETLDLNIAQLPPVCPADASLIFISDRTLSASDFTIDSRPRDLEPLLDLMEKSRDVQIDLQVSDMELHGNEEPGKVLMAKLMENCSFTSVTPLSLSIGTADLVRQTLDTASNPLLVVLLGGQHEPDSRSEMVCSSPCLSFSLLLLQTHSSSFNRFLSLL